MHVALQLTTDTNVTGDASLTGHLTPEVCPSVGVVIFLPADGDIFHMKSL